MSYVLAVAKSYRAATAASVLRADALARKLPPRAWQRLSAGSGAKGHRWYDWAWVSIDPGLPGRRHLLIRRHRRTRDLAYYRCYSPRRRPDHRAHPQCPAPSALVGLAQAAPAHGASLPLPAPSRRRPITITTYDMAAPGAGPPQHRSGPLAGWA